MARTLSPADQTETYVLLTPTQVAILSCHANLHGATPPRGVFFATWKQILHARTDAVACRELAAIVDALGYRVLEDLREVRR